MQLTFPAESDAYRAARAALFDKEIALRRAIEDVAQARRALPPVAPSLRTTSSTSVTRLASPETCG